MRGGVGTPPRPRTIGPTVARGSCAHGGRGKGSPPLRTGQLAVGAVNGSEAWTGGGAVYVYRRRAGTSGTWSLEAKLLPTNPTQYQDFGSGWSVSLQGDTLAVGRPYWSSNHGAVLAYERNGTAWNQGAARTTGGPSR